MNDVVKYQWQGQDIELTKQDVRNLISTDPNVTDKEIQLFMQLCKYQKLNPFIREAYLIKYGNKKAQMVTGIETFTKRMEAHVNFDGYIPSNNYETTTDRKKWWSEVAMHRKDIKYPIIHRVYYEEYVGTDSSGNITKIWRTKGRTMLDKCALMGGARKAYPTALGGLYEEHELDQQAIPKEIDITPKTKHEGEAIPLAAKEEVREEVKFIIEAESDFESHNLKNLEAKRKANELSEKKKNKLEAGLKGVMENLDEEVKEPFVKVEIVEERAEAMPTKEDIEAVFPPGFTPATDKQMNLMANILSSEYLKKDELEKMQGKRLSLEEAGRIISWWLGDKDNGIVGEREVRGMKDAKKPKGKKDKLIDHIRDTARIKQIPKEELKKIAGIKTFDTLMGCKIEVLEKVLDFCLNYGNVV